MLTKDQIENATYQEQIVLTRCGPCGVAADAVDDFRDMCSDHGRDTFIPDYDQPENKNVRRVIVYQQHEAAVEDRIYGRE